MPEKELIATVARDLLLKVVEKDVSKLNLRGGTETINDLGEHFKLLVSKVQEALKALDG